MPHPFPPKIRRIYCALAALLLVLLLADLCFGATFISPLAALKGWWQGAPALQNAILLNYRIPKALTAIMVGISLSISGLQMQTVFRNPLADPYILGVSAGAGLGVALFLLGGGWWGVVFASPMAFHFGQAFAAWLGASCIMVVLLLVSTRMRNIMAMLILGVMLGSAAAAIIGLLQYFGSAASLKSYVLWTMGNLGNISNAQLLVLSLTTLLGSAAALLSTKTLNALMLGEEYARSIGYRVMLHRTLIVITATMLTGTATAFCGPIGFIGIAIPNVTRMLLRQANHRYLMPATMLLGAAAMLLCDTMAQLPGYETSLPINIITALLGIPVVVFVIVRNQNTV